ncbi:hypothetical protein HWV62_11876 [Athelia sp. TMB]|nr:hypothetical protein HWV62_11876 [Athelia sp. TMB]
MPYIKCDQLPLRTLGRAGSFYVKILLDGDEKYRTARTKGQVPIVWSDICYLHHTLHRDKFMGSWKVVVGDLVETYASGIVFVAAIQTRRVLMAPPGPARITQKLRNVDAQETPITVTASIATTPQGIGAESTNQMRRPNTPAESQRSSGSVESTPSTTVTARSLMIPSAGDETTGDQTQRGDAFAQPSQIVSSSSTGANAIPLTLAPTGTAVTSHSSIDTARNNRTEVIRSARKRVDNIRSPPPIAGKLEQAFSTASDAADGLGDFSDTLGFLLSKLKVFVDVTDQLAEIHPYAKLAWSILSLVPKVVIAAKERDESLCDLMNTIEDVHSFAIDAEPIKAVGSQRKVLEDMSNLTIEAAYFIGKCTVDESFWKRMATLQFAGTDTIMVRYNSQFKALKTAFQEHAMVNIQIDTFRCLERVEDIGITVARGIADLDTRWRSELYKIVGHDSDLRGTESISRQWEHFILPMADSLSTIGPIVVVIDALDESGDVQSRVPLLERLASKASEFPSNFRILITARPEPDIWRAFSTAPHVQIKDLDTIDPAATEDDIAKFIMIQLASISTILNRKMPEAEWCGGLVAASDHLFQWADTACLAILHAKRGHLQTAILVDLIKNKRNLDELYTTILAREFEGDDETAMSCFRRVMGNVLAAKEPLSIQSHSELWLQSDPEDMVESIIGSLGSLLSGTNVRDVPIGALHTSFFDFLTDVDRSKIYYVDPQPRNQHLALACVRIMSTNLVFNICQLESSHQRNSAVLDLAARVRQHITPVLSYSCRFLGAHVTLTAQDQVLQDELKRFLHEQFLYWLEVLSLEGHMNEASRSLAAILAWTQNHGPDLTAFVKDTMKFVNVFAPLISESVPHIYLSALPFAPKSSLVARQYLIKYPSTLNLASGSLSNWPAALKVMEGHTDWVNAVAYSPDGQHIVSGSDDGSAWVRDAETGEAVAGPFECTSTVKAVVYSPNGKHIVVGCDDGGLRIIDAETGENVGGTLQGHTDCVRSVAYSPCGKFIASGSDDHTIRLWDTVTGICATTLLGHDGWVMAVAYSLDGKHIASGSRDRTIRVWDAETYKTVGVPFEGHTGGVSSVAFSPDSMHIVSGSWDTTIRVWDITGQLVAGPFGGHSRGINSVAYSKDGSFVATGSEDKTVRVLDSQTGVTVAGPLEGHSAAVRSVAFSPDGRCIVSGADDNTVRVWDAKSIGVAAKTVEERRGGVVLAIACSPDVRHIASGSQEGGIRIWNLETGELVWGSLEGHSDLVRSIAYSPDGKHVVSGSDDGTIRIWSGETGAIVAEPFRFHSGWVMAVAWSPDGKYIVSGSYDSTICIWDATVGKIVLGPLTGHSQAVASVAYSPDGKQIVSGSWDKTIRLWDGESGEMVSGPFGHSESVTSVAFSPDGQLVVSGSADKTVCVWDINTGQIAAGPFEGHSGEVNSVVYSPDGKYITSCSDDKTIRMWDVETGEIIAGPFTAHSWRVSSVAYSRDGKYLVSGSWDHTIRVWRVEQALAWANLSGSDIGSAGFRDDCPMDKGWVSTASGDLLFWVPSWHREGLFWPSNTAVIASNPTQLEMSRFVHGVRWQECKGPETAQ